MADPSPDYQQGYYDAMKRVWDMSGSLQAQYANGGMLGEAKIEGLAELAALIVADLQSHPDWKVKTIYGWPGA